MATSYFFKVIVVGVLLLNFVFICHHFVTRQPDDVSMVIENPENSTTHELGFPDFESLQGYEFRYSMTLPQEEESGRGITTHQLRHG